MLENMRKEFSEEEIDEAENSDLGELLKKQNPNLWALIPKGDINETRKDD